MRFPARGATSRLIRQPGITINRVYSWFQSVCYSTAPTRPPVVVLSGPTASGKTNISLRLAEQINGEIVSADSVQVYRGLDIGTDKPSKEDLARIPHHLVSVLDLDQTFSAGKFVDATIDCIKDILERDKVPIVAGGTPFYIKSLLEGTPGTPESDIGTTIRVDEMLEGMPWDDAFALLMEKDPVYAKSINRNDWMRLKRALCVIELSGRPLSSFQPKQHPLLSKIDLKCFCLFPPRAALFEHIDARCEQLVDRGLVEETLVGMCNELELNTSVSRAVGYRQAIEYIRKSWARERHITVQSRRRQFWRFLLTYQAATRQLAGKQIRAFRSHDQHINILRANFDDEENDRIANVLAGSIAGKTVKSSKLPSDNKYSLQGYQSVVSHYLEAENVDEKIDAIQSVYFDSAETLELPTRHILDLMERLGQGSPVEYDDADDDEDIEYEKKATKRTRGDRRRDRWLNQRQIPTTRRSREPKREPAAIRFDG